MNEKEWRKKFSERLVEKGLDKEFADKTAQAVDTTDVDFIVDDPADAADEELSYWGD